MKKQDHFRVDKLGGKIAYPGKAPCVKVAYEAQLRHIWHEIKYVFRNS